MAHKSFSSNMPTTNINKRKDWKTNIHILQIFASTGDQTLELKVSEQESGGYSRCRFMAGGNMWWLRMGSCGRAQGGGGGW